MVRGQPEEKVRSALLQQMCETLGYPRALIAVEVELARLPHVQKPLVGRLPTRRLDALVFTTNEEGGLVPLLLIECKAEALNLEAAQQVIGYNAFVGAPFLALANAHAILLGTFDPLYGQFCFRSGLPSYPELCAARPHGSIIALLASLR